MNMVIKSEPHLDVAFGFAPARYHQLVAESFQHLAAISSGDAGVHQSEASQNHAVGTTEVRRPGFRNYVDTNEVLVYAILAGNIVPVWIMIVNIERGLYYRPEQAGAVWNIILRHHEFSKNNRCGELVIGGDRWSLRIGWFRHEQRLLTAIARSSERQ